MLRKVIVILLIAVVVGYPLYQRLMSPAGMPPGMMAGGPPPVGVAAVIAREVQQGYEFTGRLSAVESAQIRPRVGGTIEKIHFSEGQLVSKGQPLFTIDPRPYAAALQAAQARVTLADAELARAKKLLDEKAVPQREYDQRRNDAEVARAELTRARLDYDYTVIESPVAGRVSRAEITLGNLVDAGGNAPVLTTVVSSDPIYADFDVDEATYLRYMRSIGGDKDKLRDIPVTLTLTGDETAYRGHVQSFDNQLDIRSGTIRVRAVFDNKDGTLVPGLFARVKLKEAVPSRALLITDRAVGTDQNRKFVLVVGAENKTERREIKLGGLADGLRVVTSGLKEGEQIIVSGMQRVMMPGQPVQPEPTSMEAPAEPATPAAVAPAPADGAPAQAEGGAAAQ